MIKKGRFLIFSALAIALTASQLHAEDCANDCSAYVESSKASYMAALLPIGALIVAAVIIATTDQGHHHHHSSRGHHHHSSKGSRSSSSSGGSSSSSSYYKSGKSSYSH